MTKKQLVDKIIAKYGHIYKTIINEMVGDKDTGQYFWYKAIVLETTENGTNAIAIPYFVANEGKEDEFADVMQGHSQRIEEIVTKTTEDLEAEQFETQVKARLLQLKVEAEAQRRLNS